MPGVFISIKIYEIPLCLGASGSVRTKQNIISENCALEVQIFCPFIIKSSPSSTALVWREARSEPDPGSE